MTPVHELLSHTAARVPEKVALVGTDVSYRVLELRARALARSFASRGVALGDRVVVWLPKSPAYVISIFGALHAGAAYVPLDATQPVARVRAILDDCEPTALVTTPALLRAIEQVPSSVQAVWVVGEGADKTCVDRALVGFEAAFTTGGELVRPTELSDIAAILYTSGSTGTPKGVMISHLNLANFIAWAREEMNLCETDVFSNHASFNFDLSTFDLFGAVAVGASVWVIPDASARNAAALSGGIASHGITVWYSVPSVLALLLESRQLSREMLAPVRYLLFAGEVFPIKQLRRLRELLPADARLYNLYGPTETNVCTFHRVDAIDPARQVPVPIGRPIAGARLRVVDANGETVSAGELGELIVEGPCVTPGYFRRPHDPNTENHRCNRHATGDVVAYEDGELVYRGRKDRMVKLGGFRVELGEIEAALLRHPSVEEAAVITIDGDAGAQLIAFCSPDAGAGLLEIKTHCGALLPRYMIPHMLVRLAALPKNANGKIDYLQLRGVARDRI